MAYIPNELLKCVAFLGFNNQHNEYGFAGSSFWISRPGPDDIKEEYRPAYLATQTCTLTFVFTSVHVIATIEKKSADGRVWLRINTKSGGINQFTKEEEFEIADRRQAKVLLVGADGMGATTNTTFHDD